MLTIPAAFTALTFYPQWVLYKLVPRPDGGTDKLPVDWRTGQLPAAGMGGTNIWATSDDVTAAAARFGTGYGSGFSFADSDPFWFIDLDKALIDRDADGNAIPAYWAQWALDVVNALPGVAIEVSQSGRGLHLIGTGTIPHHACKCPNDNRLEMYHVGRFVALTGYSAGGDAFHDASVPLAGVVARWFPTNSAPIAPLAHHANRDAPDDETLAELRSALTSLSPDDYHEWTAIGIALSSIGEPGYELWATWSATSAKHDADRDLAKWSTFHPDRTGFASIFSKAQANGWINPKARKPIDLTGMFGDTAAPVTTATAPAPVTTATAPAPPTEALSEPPKPPKPTDPATPPPAKRNINDAPTAITGSTLAFGDDQAKIFAGCAYVLDRDEVLLPNGTFANKSQFDNWYGKFSYVKSADNAGVEKSAWNAFVRSQLLNFAKAESYCFDPALEFGEIANTPDGVVVNTFKPITTPSIEGDCSPILEHLHKILPVGDDAEIYLSYMAAMIQNPGRKIAWCPILQGTKGNGKSLIGELMERVMTFKYTHRPSGKDINNKFTGWMDRLLLIVLEELGVKYETRETLDTLKVMISGKRIEIQGKGKDQVTGDNRANFMVFVNDKDAVPINDDERRYASLFCAQQSAEDIVRDGMNAAYFKRLATWIETVGAAHFHHYLKNYKIQDKFNPAEEAQRAPLTSSRQEAIQASRGSVEHEVVEMIESKARGFAGGWICSLDLDAMLKANRMEKQMPRQKRRAMLQSLGYDWHPALQLGRTNNPITGYGSKPVLFIKKGHPHQLLLTGAEVVKAYLDAQPVDGVAKSGLVRVFGHGGEP